MRYSAHIEVTDKTPLDDLPDLAVKIQKMAALNGVLGQHPRGWLAASMVIHADDPVTAAAGAVAAVEGVYGHPVLSLRIVPTDEDVARAKYPTHPIPKLYSVTEVAEKLGVTRQAVLQQITVSKTLPAIRIGTTYAIPATALGDREA